MTGDILYTPVFQFVAYLQPEFCALIFHDPYAKYVLITFPIDAQGNISGFCYDPPFFTYFKMHGIKEYNRVKAVQRPAVPVLCLLGDFVCNI